jgi:structure-specific recognition protein 1
MVIRLIIFPNNGQLQNPGKKDFKREVSSSKAVAKRKSRDGEESQKKRKPKKKKDPNAPKRSKSAYVFFSQMEREVGSLLFH